MRKFKTLLPLDPQVRFPSSLKSTEREAIVCPKKSLERERGRKVEPGLLVRRKVESRSLEKGGEEDCSLKSELVQRIRWSDVSSLRSIDTK